MGNLLRWLAVIPGIILIVQVYKQDKMEKEPFGLILKLLAGGALTVISALILETIGETIVYDLLPSMGWINVAIECFLVVALAEEGGKLLIMKLLTWNNRAFNYRFDGIVYAVCASMGFAIVENIFYVVDGGFSTAILRAITAMPGHCIFAIFMGHYYGEAKLWETRGNEFAKKSNLSLALWMPVLIHGFYDLCLSLDSVFAVITFFIFVVALDIYTIKKIKQYSNEDMAFFSVYVNPWDHEF